MLYCVTPSRDKSVRYKKESATEIVENRIKQLEKGKALCLYSSMLYCVAPSRDQSGIY